MLTIFERAQENGKAKGKVQGRADALRHIVCYRKVKLSAAQAKANRDLPGSEASRTVV
jgi:hypothetical protein